MASLAGDERFVRLASWSKAQGGAMHEDVGIYVDDVTGVSLRVRPDAIQELPTGSVAIQCPLSTTLSYLNVLAAGMPLGTTDGPPTPEQFCFPADFVAETPPHVLGRFFLMQQYLLGSSSFWSPYIATLPQPEDRKAWNLPALWRNPNDAEDADSLEDQLFLGTNVHVAATEMRDNVEREYSQAFALLERLAYPSVVSFTRRLYDWAFCIFTSRSFRPSLVLGKDLQASLLGTADHVQRQMDDIRLPAGCQIDDFSMLLPVLDIGNHDPRAQTSWEPHAACGSDNSLAEAGVAFRVMQPYAAGQQVYNNYGMKTNSELLLGYGFLLPPTAKLHNDYVHLRKRGENSSSVTGTGGGGPPRDFLLSLRPMDDPSSLVGGSRRWWRGPLPRLRNREVVAQPQPAPLPAAFARFEDALLWDICSSVWKPKDKQDALAVLGVGASTPVAVLDNLPTEQKAALLDYMLATPDEDKEEHESENGGESAVEGPPFAALRHIVEQTLFAKSGMDYDRLLDADADFFEAIHDEKADKAHVKLAIAYRTQYRAVLSGALVAINPELDLEAEEQAYDE